MPPLRQDTQAPPNPLPEKMASLLQRLPHQTMMQHPRNWRIASACLQNVATHHRHRLCSSSPSDAPRQRKTVEKKEIREYFYYVDHHGRLHLEDTNNESSGRKKVFNMATCLKEPKFLNFFFKRLVPNTLDEGAQYLPSYNYVSPCGRELNFVRAEDTGLVFQRLEEGQLFYAPALSVPFQPEQLCVSDDGRLYHPAPRIGLGLMASGLVHSFQDRLEVDSEGHFLLHLDETVLKLPPKSQQ